jgi:hypothetical protein
MPFIAHWNISLPSPLAGHIGCLGVGLALHKLWWIDECPCLLSINSSKTFLVFDLHFAVDL